MIGYCKKCHGAIFVENISKNRVNAELTCVWCGWRSFAKFELIETIMRAKGVKLDRL